MEMLLYTAEQVAQILNLPARVINEIPTELLTPVVVECEQGSYVRYTSAAVHEYVQHLMRRAEEVKEPNHV